MSEYYTQCNKCDRIHEGHPKKCSFCGSDELTVLNNLCEAK